MSSRSQILALMGLFMLSFSLLASTQQMSTKPTASVQNSCMVVTTDNLDFGSYTPSAPTALQTAGQIKMLCTKGSVATLTPVSGGKIMSGVGGNLNYALYTDSALSKIWGGGGGKFSHTRFV